MINLPEQLYEPVRQLFEEITAEYQGRAKQWADILRVSIVKLFLLINRVNESGDSNGPATYNQILLGNFQKLINEHFVRLRLPKDYAELLYITPNHLNAVCKDLLGIPAGEVIRNRIMLEAKRLLTNPQLTITEIALELNFNDNSYFTKFFKKFEGKTPEEFRKTITNNHHE